MVIPSRTPEGDPNRCPVCGHDCRLEPSWPSRDGPCPRCGHLLWFGQEAGVLAPETRTAVLEIIKERFGMLPPEMESAVAELTGRADVERMLQRALTARSLAELFADS